MALPLAAVLGGSALLGGLGGLFGSKNNAKPVFINPQFNEVAERFGTQRLPALIDANQSGLNAYQAAIDAARPVRTALAAEDVDVLGNPIRTGFNYDPVATGERWRSGGLSDLRSFIPDITGSINRNVNARSRALGLGGTTPNPYGNSAIAKALGESLSPILAGIFGGAGRDAAGFENSRLQNALLTLQMMKERSEIPNRAAQAELLPNQARLAEFGAETDQLGTIGRALQSNVAGMNIQENPIGSFLKGAQGGLGTGALLSSVIGGAGGGLFGGAPNPVSTLSNPSLYRNPLLGNLPLGQNLNMIGQSVALAPWG